MCGEPLATQPTYWVTAHPDGVHDGCRAWHEEGFPFAADLARLRVLVRALARLRETLVDDGRWLARVEKEWPGRAGVARTRAREWAQEWAHRKEAVQHRLAVLKDRLEL